MKKLILLFILIILLLAVFSQLPDNKLHIYICDVGQGDGILITKGTTQIVIDAGPDNSIESCLGSHMPFWDQTIEVALMTHADSDHSFGFVEMLSRYSVKNFLVSPIDSNSNSQEFANLKQEVIREHIHLIPAKAGDEIKVNGIDMKIIFPDEAFFESNSRQKPSVNVMGSREGLTNDFCAIAFLKYGKFTGLFTCDTSPLSEQTMLNENRVPHAYLLKVPHHGSKNGLTEDFLRMVNPKIAAISVGKKNRYGHPSPEIIQMLQRFGVKTFRTDEHGEISVTTDGDHVWVK